jgi:hypothetical protein
MSCMIVRLSLPLAPLWLRACAGTAERTHRAAWIGTMILRRMLDSFRRPMSCRGVVVGLRADLLSSKRSRVTLVLVPAEGRCPSGDTRK